MIIKLDQVIQVYNLLTCAELTKDLTDLRLLWFHFMTGQTNWTTRLQVKCVYAGV